MQRKKCAPVIIPTLNRYDHFKKCLESLEKCVLASQTEIYVGLDYPPSEKYAEGWRSINKYLKEKEGINGFMKLTVFRRTSNCGIKGEHSNIALLQKYVLEHYDCYIESEDDNVFSPNFLLFMNQCLEKYKDDPDVIAVTGYSYPVDWENDSDATIQKQNFNASAWGWGWWTEKRKMVMGNISSGDMYNKAPEVLSNHLFKKNIFNSFYEYVCASIIPIEHLGKIKSGRLSITDYSTRQYLTVYGKYIISPLVSKVRNLGYDGSGVYCQQIINGDGSDEWHTNFSEQPIDDSQDFVIIENSEAHLAENLRRLDNYQKRPMSRHIVANLISFGIRAFGLAFMREFTSVVFKVWHRRVN